MRDLGRVVAQIPARAESKRVPAKNLRFLAGKPLIAYAIECAKACDDLDEIYVNTDSPEIAALATELGVNVFHRDAHLASDTATGDEFTADFIEKLGPDTAVMINPVCPLVQPNDVAEAIAAFRQSECDTLISCSETQMQTFCEGHAVNINSAAPLARSQDNPSVQTLNWAVTIWDAPAYLERWRRQGYAYLGEHRLLFALPPMHGIKISEEADFCAAERLVRTDRAIATATAEPRYWAPES